MKIGFVIGIDHIVQAVREDLKQNLPHQRKIQRDNMATLIGTMLHSRSTKIMDVGGQIATRCRTHRHALPVDHPFSW
jgi:hypothetical protein